MQSHTLINQPAELVEALLRAKAAMRPRVPAAGARRRVGPTGFHHIGDVAVRADVYDMSIVVTLPCASGGLVRQLRQLIQYQDLWDHELNTLLFLHLHPTLGI